MDARLTSEQRQLRDAAARLAADLGPGSVAELSDVDRVARLEKAVDATGWRALRSDDASGVEVAIVAEEFARRLVDVSFLGPTLADDLRRHIGDSPATGAASSATVAVGGEAVDAHGFRQALALDGVRVAAWEVGNPLAPVDLTRTTAELVGPPRPLGELEPDQARRWRALALVVTCAELVGAARGTHALACDYAKVREQYGSTIGSYQAVAHLLAEGLALIEGSVSVLRHAAWAVDELDPDEAVQAALVAKVYTTRAARTVCETSIQVHGGIGNTWDCLAHVYLRKVLADPFQARLQEVHSGLS
jgi:alkylation response protein AidB-like acyl-CoA dehydrogenase